MYKTDLEKLQEFEPFHELRKFQERFTLGAVLKSKEDTIRKVVRQLEERIARIDAIEAELAGLLPETPEVDEME